MFVVGDGFVNFINRRVGCFSISIRGLLYRIALGSPGNYGDWLYRATRRNLDYLDWGDGLYRGSLGGGVLRAPWNLRTFPSECGFILSLESALVALLDFGATAFMVPLPCCLFVFCLVRIDVCPIFVSNLGLVLLFSRMAKDIMHFSVTSNYLNQLIPCIGEIWANRRFPISRRNHRRRIVILVWEVCKWRCSWSCVWKYEFRTWRYSYINVLEMVGHLVGIVRLIDRSLK